MEDLVSFRWAGRRVLLTGHTGFKGSWMALWLAHRGAHVVGYALDPPGRPCLYEAARVGAMIDDQRGDVRDLASLQQSMTAARPEIVFHMAAQSLVRRSYTDPVGTYATNMLGTVHVLEAVRRTPSVRAVIAVTTDKCYENSGQLHGYAEGDRLGGHDPYSNSKACAELAAQCYRDSFLVPVATARAGNVIGGGDWAEGRLVPDLVRAFIASQPAQIRHPQAIRPWQHVLEPLQGYLILGERLLAGHASFASAWNFGPVDEDARPVRWIAEHMAAKWPGSTARWEADGGAHPHEAASLKLDSTRARGLLGWRPMLRLPEALDWIIEWFEQWQAGADMQAYTLGQIVAYERMIADG